MLDIILDKFTVSGLIAAVIIITLLAVCACRRCKLCKNEG